MSIPFQLTLTQDKLIDLLMHAATREDIAQLDNKIDSKSDQFENKFTQIDNRFTHIENRFTQIENRFTQLENKLIQLDNKLDTKFEIARKETREGLLRLDAKYTHLMFFMVASIFMPVIVPVVTHFIK